MKLGKKFRVGLAVLSLFALALLMVGSAVVPSAHATSMSDTTDAINSWLPIIIEFAMLAMVLGLLKRVRF